jgi:hypothetical protein
VYVRNDPELKMFIISKNQKREPFIFRLIRHPKQQAGAISDDCKKRGKPVDCKGKYGSGRQNFFKKGSRISALNR